MIYGFDEWSIVDTDLRDRLPYLTQAAIFNFASSNPTHSTIANCHNTTKHLLVKFQVFLKLYWRLGFNVMKSNLVAITNAWEVIQENEKINIPLPEAS